MPEPFTVMYTSTSAVIVTSSQSATFTSPLITTFPYYCLFGLSCPTNRGTETVMVTETWTSSYFCCVTLYVYRTIGVGPHVYTSTEVFVVATPVTVTAAPIIFTSTTTSTVTSSLTQTGYVTKQMAPIYTGSVYQEQAVALVIVLGVSLLLVVSSMRKEKVATGQSKLDSRHAPHGRWGGKAVTFHNLAGKLEAL